MKSRVETKPCSSLRLLNPSENVTSVIDWTRLDSAYFDAEIRIEWQKITFASFF